MQKACTHRSRGSEKEDGGIAHRVSLGWKAAFGERQKIGTKESLPEVESTEEEQRKTEDDTNLDRQTTVKNLSKMVQKAYR